MFTEYGALESTNCVSRAGLAARRDFSLRAKRYAQNEVEAASGRRTRMARALA